LSGRAAKVAARYPRSSVIDLKGALRVRDLRAHQRVPVRRAHFASFGQRGSHSEEDVMRTGTREAGRRGPAVVAGVAAAFGAGRNRDGRRPHRVDRSFGDGTLGQGSPEVLLHARPVRSTF